MSRDNKAAEAEKMKDNTSQDTEGLAAVDTAAGAATAAADTAAGQNEPVPGTQGADGAHGADGVQGADDAQSAQKPYLTLRGVGKQYVTGDIVVDALKDVSFDLYNGEFVVVLGSSGAGKTTLLNLLGGMDNATSGEIVLDGKDVTKLDRKGLTDFRRNDVGFVFQFYNLMPNLTALENVEIAVEICKDHLDPKDVLTKVGLAERLNNFPAQLSGGEQQRVSIARAIAKSPKLLLCDEPTGALDYKTGKNILTLLYNISKQHGKLVVVVTHNSAIKEIADKVIRIKSGQIESIEVNPSPMPVELLEW